MIIWCYANAHLSIDVGSMESSLVEEWKVGFRLNNKKVLLEGKRCPSCEEVDGLG